MNWVKDAVFIAGLAVWGVFMWELHVEGVEAHAEKKARGRVATPADLDAAIEVAERCEESVQRLRDSYRSVWRMG